MHLLWGKIRRIVIGTREMGKMLVENLLVDKIHTLQTLTNMWRMELIRDPM